MELKITTKEGEDPPRSHVGLEVCRGPGTLRLLITWPYNRGGRVVEIPLSEIDSVTSVEDEHRILGETPVRPPVG